MWQWGEQGGPIAYDQSELQRKGTALECAVLNVKKGLSLEPLLCGVVKSDQAPPEGFICMRPNPTRETGKLSLSGVSFPRASKTPTKFQTKECPDGSLVQTFHRCQWGEEDDDDDSGWSPLHLPLFQCRFGPAVHYSLLCDGKYDCQDRSDETNCHKPQFAPLQTSSFICRKFQAVPVLQRCDGMPDCFDESDEEFCESCTHHRVLCQDVGCIPMHYANYFQQCASNALTTESASPATPPRRVHLDGTGMSSLVTGDCGEGFFHCQGGHCIPTFLLNNGEQDCPRGEDEGITMDNVTCPGYYRCHGSGNCVDSDRLCDNIYHCPNKDDEMFCHMTCPRDQGCRCEGWAYTCSGMIDPLENLHVRYLDLSHASNVTLEKLHYMEYLAFLNLSSCGLGNVTLFNMPQLRVLDLSFNLLTGLFSLSLRHFSAFEFLDLSDNSFVTTIGSDFALQLAIGQLRNLRTLLMTNVGLEVIDDKAFSPLSSLKHLDLRKNPLQRYVEGSLIGLTSLEELHTDESKLCCHYFHPTVLRCYAPFDELSSCSDLLAQDFFRAFLWVLSCQAIVGNIGVLVYRVVIATHNSASASVVLVKNLCLSDLLMGIYMMVIGVADVQFRGEYVAQENGWKSSVTCTVAGFLSFVSSEVSAFVVCLITLDRVLVICFPFHSHLHLSHVVTVILCCGAWVLGCVLAAVPLLAGLEFYGQNGICVPLPITRQQFSGQRYAFAVFIVLNFVLFLAIGVGQAVIYSAVRNSSKAAGNQMRERDMALARRLLVVVLTDFCCWFPIGLLGLLAARGAPVPGVVNVWAAIFVLPLNSALNPFLYTLNSVLRKRRARRMEKRTKKTLGRLRTEIATWQPASVHELVRICVSSRVVDRETLQTLLGVKDAATVEGQHGEDVDQGRGENDSSIDNGNRQAVSHTTLVTHDATL
ncbi:G-protein coupled receptor GRL101-like [Littorina saxatilis]|uniref:G-protein coupled receptor GRL101-like n=1 Tax=Littorina saxatilis TaxID=31220 RepID=UPI0038B41A99